MANVSHRDSPNPELQDWSVVLRGTGSPEGVVTADSGALYAPTDTTNQLYQKSTDDSNTGWVLMATATDVTDIEARLDTLEAGTQIPYYRMAGSHVSALGGGIITLAWPNHAVDDIALAIVEANWGNVGPTDIEVFTASGFQRIGSLVQHVGSSAQFSGTQLGVYWCRATSAAMAAVEFTTGLDHLSGQIITFRNVANTGDPWDVVATDNNEAFGTALTLPAVTTTLDNTLVLTILSTHVDGTGTWTSGWTNAALVDYREIIDIRVGTGNGGGIAAAVGIKETAGSTGTSAVTSATSSWSAMLTLALKPAT